MLPKNGLFRHKGDRKLATRSAPKSRRQTRKSKGSKRSRARARSVAKQHSHLPFIQTTLVILTLLAVGVTYVWQKEEIKTKRYDIQELSRNGSKLVEDIRLLKKEVARLEAAGRIERIAVAQLHMCAPSRWQTVPVRIGDVPDDRASNRDGVAAPAR